MKALTLRQPWASAVIICGKDVENRSWPTKHRGPLAIHAGTKFDWDAAKDVHRISGAMFIQTPHAEVIGTVNVTGCHHASDCATPEGGFCSKWALADNWHWELSDAFKLTTPFPEKGKLGLWNLGPTTTVGQAG